MFVARHSRDIKKVCFQDVDVEHGIKKHDWKKTHVNMMKAIKEAKKAAPPSAAAGKKRLDVEIVLK